MQFTCKIFLACIHQLLLTIFHTYGFEEQTMEVHIYTGSDLAEVVNTTFFVDKSLLMKRFYDNTKHGSGILITTPRYFGKSVNMDMLRRFFQMNVNWKGERVHVEKTQNYNLFRNNFMKIYRLQPFFKKHFGKYGVITIDYEPLGKIKTMEEMLGVFFVHVMRPAFTQHHYLLNDTFLWAMDKEHGWISKTKFEKFVLPELSHQLTEPEVQSGFSFLAKLLHKRFEERVIVLIDNYDSFMDSPLYSENPNIFYFLSIVNVDLLRCESVDRSLVTGRIRSSGSTKERGQMLPSNIVDNEALWGFYGLNSVELDNLLQPVVHNEEERQRVMGRIVHEYSGYSVATLEAGDGGSGQILDSQTCSVWSVIQYMEKVLNVENISSLV